MPNPLVGLENGLRFQVSSALKAQQSVVVISWGIQNPLSSTSNVHVQLPPQSNCQSLSRSSIFAVPFPKCRPVARVSVVLSCSIRESCGPTVREVKLQHRMQISTLLLMHVTDQGFSPAWSDSICTLLFHPCKSSCHGDAQLVSVGGPTAMRINRRYSTSNFARSSL